jgi:hypothetical protein
MGARPSPWSTRGVTWPRLASLFVVAVGAGCFSQSLLQDPTPMPRGRVRGAIGFELQGEPGKGPQTIAPAAALRVGVAPRTEARGKIGYGGFELGVNVQVLDTERVDLMVMPGFFYADVDDFFVKDTATTEMRGAALPVIASVNLDEAEQYRAFAGPVVRVARQREDYEGNTAVWSALGVAAGFSVGGPRDYASLIPEIAWQRNLTGLRGGTQGLTGKGRSSLSISLGVSFGQRAMPDRH